MKVFAGLLSALGAIFGQFIFYHIVAAVVPSYMGLWVAAVVLTWVGLIASVLSE